MSYNLKLVYKKVYTTERLHYYTRSKIIFDFTLKKQQQNTGTSSITLNENCLRLGFNVKFPSTESTL